MPIFNYIILFILCVSALACNESKDPTPSSEKIMINLTPLSPYKYEFKNQRSKSNAINYFFTERKRWQNKLFRNSLEKKIKNIQSKISEDYMFFSIYIYEGTEILNENFRGENTSLQGVYDSNLISYARWKQGELDIFYLIDSGNVVFDMIKDTEISPTWEFD